MALAVYTRKAAHVHAQSYNACTGYSAGKREAQQYLTTTTAAAIDFISIQHFLLLTVHYVSSSPNTLVCL